MKLLKSKQKIKEKIKSKPPLAWVALCLIIIGAVSFGKHTTIGYLVLGSGFALGAYVDFFARKNKKIEK